jgi:hypothetical protein
MHVKVPFDRSLNPFGTDSIRVASRFRPPHDLRAGLATFVGPDCQLISGLNTMQAVADRAAQTISGYREVEGGCAPPLMS